MSLVYTSVTFGPPESVTKLSGVPRSGTKKGHGVPITFAFSLGRRTSWLENTLLETASLTACMGKTPMKGRIIHDLIIHLSRAPSDRISSGKIPFDSSEQISSPMLRGKRSLENSSWIPECMEPSESIRTHSVCDDELIEGIPRDLNTHWVIRVLRV